MKWKNKIFSEALDLRTIQPLIDSQFSQNVLNAAEASLELIFPHYTSQIILKMANLTTFEVKTTQTRIDIIQSLTDILTNKIQEGMKFLVSQKCDTIFHENISYWNKKVFDCFVRRLSRHESVGIGPIGDRIERGSMIVPSVFYRNVDASFRIEDHFFGEMLQKLKTFFGPNFEVRHLGRRERHICH